MFPFIPEFDYCKIFEACLSMKIMMRMDLSVV